MNYHPRRWTPETSIIPVSFKCFSRVADLQIALINPNRYYCINTVHKGITYNSASQIRLTTRLFINMQVHKCAITDKYMLL